MRRRKLSVGWCIRLYYSDRNCKYSLYFVHIHAYANTNSRESVGKFNTFFQIFYFSGKYFTLKFSIWFCNFSKIAWAKKFRFLKISKSRFFGQFWRWKNYHTEGIMKCPKNHVKDIGGTQILFRDLPKHSNIRKIFRSSC